jgi:hypothetical protein
MVMGFCDQLNYDELFKNILVYLPYPAPTYHVGSHVVGWLVSSLIGSLIGCLIRYLVDSSSSFSFFLMPF